MYVLPLEYVLKMTFVSSHQELLSLGLRHILGICFPAVQSMVATMRIGLRSHKQSVKLNVQRTSGF